MENFYESIEKNKRRSFFVVLFFFIFILVAAYFVSSALSVLYGYNASGIGIAGIALIISGISTFASYYFSDSIILSISKAKPADRSVYFDFYTVTENLSIGAGIPKPKLFVIEDSAPNAFATGRDPDHAVVVATTGLLEKLKRSELEGVIAHELSHVKNYDTRLLSLVSVMVGSIALLSDILLRSGRFRGRKSDEKNQIGVIIFALGIVFAILSPIIANLIKLAISRRREFLADAGSVSITRQPGGLISALEKISQDKEALEVANKATAHLYITNPFKGKKGFGAVGNMAKLFNTHPPVEERIKALKRMS